MLKRAESKDFIGEGNGFYNVVTSRQIVNLLIDLERLQIRISTTWRLPHT